MDAVIWLVKTIIQRMGEMIYNNKNYDGIAEGREITPEGTLLSEPGSERRTNSSPGEVESCESESNCGEIAKLLGPSAPSSTGNSTSAERASVVRLSGKAEEV